jgi:hypothetical protein
MTNDQRMIALEARITGGEPFTYGDLCVVAGGDVDRLVDKTIQKWRRRGWIYMDGRIGRAPRWLFRPEAYSAAAA